MLLGACIGRHARAMSVGASPAALAAPATASASASIDTAAKRGDGGAAITAAEYKEVPIVFQDLHNFL